MSGRIPITRPVFGDEERAAVARPLDSGWVVQGPFVAEFERLFAAFVGAPHAVATSSCTTALHAALAALGVGPGAEVIVPAFTWVSTPNVVEQLGARAVFCDIDLATFNIDVARVESLVTPNTVGIMPAHLFGLVADMAPLMDVAGRRGLWVVEDAACAFGAWYAGRHAGTFGAAGCFSFHPRKSITTGEGGMIVTPRGELDALLRSLRDHGATGSDFDRHADAGGFLLSEYPRAGFNYRMTDIQGALGCAQMARADAILSARRRLAAVYDAALAGVEWLRRPVVPDGCVHGYQAYVTLFAPHAPSPETIEPMSAMRRDVMASLEARGIATRQGTHAAVLTGHYARRYGLRPEMFPNAWAADRLSLALPLFPQLTADEQARVCDALVAAAAAVV